MLIKIYNPSTVKRFFFTKSANPQRYSCTLETDTRRNLANNKTTDVEIDENRTHVNNPTLKEYVYGSTNSIKKICLQLVLLYI